MFTIELPDVKPEHTTMYYTITYFRADDGSGLYRCIYSYVFDECGWQYKATGSPEWVEVAPT